MNLNGKKIAVLGLGKEGRELAEFFNKSEINADFFDENPGVDAVQITEMGFSVKIGPDAFDNLSNYDLIFKSPGISPHHPKLHGLSGRLTSATRLFFDVWPGEIIGVTGTKGKGTTASLIYDILTSSNRRVVLVGNIGNVELSGIADYEKDSIAVMEISSFQLMSLGISPHIAVVLDIDSEHLDYHKDTQEYRVAKAEIVIHQKPKDYLVITANNPAKTLFTNLTLAKVVEVGGSSKEYNTVWWQGNVLSAQIGGQEINRIINADKVKLKGRHNLNNIACAAAVGLLYNIAPDEIAQSVYKFKGLPMRLETIGTFGGIEFINDSASTNPKTVWAAVEAMNKPTILIMGGRNKGLDYTDIIHKVKSVPNIRKVIVFGELKDDLKNLIDHGQIFIKKATLEQSLAEAKSYAESGWVVLFSPGAASFDQFINYQTRGQKFNKLVYEFFH